MNTRPLAIRKQRGITLIVTMVMLVMMTLFALSAMRISNINLRIVGNYQWQKEMELLTDSALEWVISGVNTFDNTAVQGGTAIDSDICANGQVVALGTCTLLNPKIGTVKVPRCTGSHVAEGYTKKLGELSPDDNEWVISASASDSFTGAKVTVYRGVTVRMLAGNCPE